MEKIYCQGRLRSWQYRILTLLWTGYASYYLCRVNFTVAQPEILKDFTDWTAAQIGVIPSVYAACYAIGQFVNGQIGDRFGACKMMTIALIVAGFTNVGLAAADDYWLMIVLWGLNGYAQSAGWSLVVQTLSNWTTSKRRGVLVGLISTCYQLGNVVSWLVAGFLCQELNWRAAFLIPGLFVFPMAGLVWVLLRNRPEDAGLPQVRDDVGAAPKAGGAVAVDAGPTAAEILRMPLTNPLLWILGIGYFCMNSVRYAFMNWAVQYMSDFHGQTIKGSAFTAVALPLIGAVGAVSAGWASDAWFGKRRAPVCAVMLFGQAGVCIAFVQVPQGEWIIAMAMLGLAGFLVYGPDMLMSGAATVDVSHPRAAAAATGLTMCMGATGAIFSGAGVGWLKDSQAGEENPWNLVFWVLAGLAVLSASLMVSIWNARPKGAK